MSDQPSTLKFRDLPAILIKNKWVQMFAAALMLLELYNYGAIPAYIITQKAIEAQATANVAAVRQKAEAELHDRKAIVERERATQARRLNQANIRAKEYEAAGQRLDILLAKQMTDNPAGFARDALGSAVRRLGR